jgi:hypothetical protein
MQARRTLAQLRGWHQSYVDRLASRWITSPEQVVSIAATPAGLSSLQTELGVSNSEVVELVNAAREAVPEDQVDELTRPVDPKNRGLGAILSGRDEVPQSLPDR